MQDEDKLRSCTMDLLKDIYRGDNPKFLLFANVLEELVKLLVINDKDLSDITSIVDRTTNTKLVIPKALVQLDQLYYYTNAAQEYYDGCYSSTGGVVADNDGRLIMSDEIKASHYSDKLSVINPELLFVVKGGFIDFLKIHRMDYDGGHLSYSLRYNDLGGTNENQ